MRSFFKGCGCARPTWCPHPYTIRFRNGSGKQLEGGGFDTQDDAIERLTQIYTEKKRTAPSVAEARRELGQKTVAEYAKQWRPRQRRMTEYSTGEHVNSSINVHIVPRLGSRKLISVTPIVVERFLDELEADGVGRGNQVNILRTLKEILRDAYDKGAMADDPVKGVQEPEYVRQKVAIPDLAYVKHAAHRHRPVGRPTVPVAGARRQPEAGLHAGQMPCAQVGTREPVRRHPGPPHHPPAPPRLTACAGRQPLMPSNSRAVHGPTPRAAAARKS
ncbi:hypothetical protein AB0E64_15690 [Streptomyces caelestis]|uniref:Core-binding (CB) domain-containing protein n=1 Tax=Streptomyces caelestis TaxID=36816 RepID=A0A7W9LX78_9ACTN|nr:hypothetical protein [Streptomyces caelestis]MBB5799302.1 hypothetical protein [Streptomyces caelestis]GGW45958.1 hypothetical protein GCM10010320_27570 [Streptomyces caelestis]